MKVWIGGLRASFEGGVGGILDGYYCNLQEY